MTGGQQHQPQSIPLDIAGVEADPHWRDNLAWPVPPLSLGEMYRNVLSNYLALIRGLSGEEQRIAILAMAPAIGVAATAFEFALYTSNETASGLRVACQDPTFDFLAGKSAQIPAPQTNGAAGKITAPRLPIRRNMQVTSWWTPWTRMVPTMLRPDAIAVGENELLIATARSSSVKVGFKHGGLFLRAARKHKAPPKNGLTALASKIIRALAKCVEVEEEIWGRVETLLALNYLPLLERVSSDLNGLRRASRLPKNVWSGTAGNYSTRAIGLEVMRREGTVTRFEHGGTNGMMDYPEVLAFLELFATTELVLPSERMAANVRSSGAAELMPKTEPIQIVSQPEAISPPKIDPAKPAEHGRRRVVYCPTLLLGFRRHAFSILPDPLSLDWTLRITEALLAMPIDLLCKPHPEGVFQGRAHPVAKMAETSYRRFEDEIEGADLFVFDRCHSTAFWTALNTDRPVVYLEATPPPLHPGIKDAMERRCRILHASYDDRNRPQIDPVAFRNAVVGGDSKVDPAEAQEILLGWPS